MAKLTITQQSIRVLRFLRGLGSPRAKRAMAAFGFTQGSFDEGWALLQAAASGPGGRAPASNREALKQLDVWENQWFPIIRLSLRRHHPELCERVFHELGQAEGLEVTVTVSTLLTRLSAERGSAEGDAALALLTTRGCTPQVLEQAQRLLDQFGNMALEEPDPVATAEACKKAQEDLWSWYLEWSGIARHVIEDRRTLRAMGFLQNRSSRDDDEADDDEADEPIVSESRFPDAPASETTLIA